MGFNRLSHWRTGEWSEVTANLMGTAGMALSALCWCIAGTARRLAWHIAAGSTICHSNGDSGRGCWSDGVCHDEGKFYLREFKLSYFVESSQAYVVRSLLMHNGGNNMQFFQAIDHQLHG